MRGAVAKALGLRRLWAGPVSAGGPSSGDGLLLENDTDFLLLESGDFFLLG